MVGKSVLEFDGTVLQHLRRVADGSRQLSTQQLAELDQDLASSIAHVASESSNAATMTRLTGRKVDPSAPVVDMGRLLSYFSSPLLDAEAPLQDNDLSHSLPNYFINSSHNTYLTGNQLYGNASTQAYKTVLQHVCRSIEIDVWDGKSNDLDRALQDSSNDKTSGPTGEPRVLHGHTFTKEVPFRDVCRAIADSAFQVSELPIIVSLEVHAHASQQEKMVSIMKETWKDKLVFPLDEQCRILPSPAALKNKILVKVKAAAMVDPTETSKNLSKQDTNDSRSSSEDSAPDEPASARTATATKTKKKASKIIDSLSALGIYTRAYHFKNFKVPEAALPTHVFSLSEKKVMAVYEETGADLFLHNRNYLMRAFPSGSRVDSSNLDPPVYWRKGIQMVALNWQKVDASIMLNRAMFAGSPGWVLKPLGYRGQPDESQAEASATSMNGSSPKDQAQFHDLSLRIEALAGQNLPQTKKPYLKCELHVEVSRDLTRSKSDADGKKKDGEFKRRTKVSRLLDFQSEPFEFANVRHIVPSLSFIRFKVMDDVLGPDEMVAWACIRLDRLKSGLRFMHLLDPQGAELDGTLLLNIRSSLN